MGFNGKLCGGGLYIAPFAIINDGLLDFTFSVERLGALGLVNLLDDAKSGVLGYNKEIHFIRGKTVRLVNKNPPLKK